MIELIMYTLAFVFASLVASVAPPVVFICHDVSMFCTGEATVSGIATHLTYLCPPPEVTQGPKTVYVPVTNVVTVTVQASNDVGVKPTPLR